MTPESPPVSSTSTPHKARGPHATPHDDAPSASLRIERAHSPALGPAADLPRQVDALGDCGDQDVSIRLFDEASLADEMAMRLQVDAAAVVNAIEAKIEPPRDEDGHEVAIREYTAVPRSIRIAERAAAYVLQAESDPAAQAFADHVALLKERLALQSHKARIDTAGTRDFMFAIAGRDGPYTYGRLMVEITELNGRMKATKDRQVRNQASRFEKAEQQLATLKARTRELHDGMVATSHSIESDQLGFSTTSAQMGTVPKEAEVLLAETCKALEDVLALPANEHTKALARSLAAELLRQRRLPCTLSVRSDQGQFFAQVQVRHQAWKAGLASGDESLKSLAQKLFDRFIETRWDSGVKENWDRLRFCLAYIRMADGPAFALLDETERQHHSKSLLAHHVHVVQSLYTAMVSFPIVMEDHACGPHVRAVMQRSEAGMALLAKKPPGPLQPRPPMPERPMGRSDEPIPDALASAMRSSDAADHLLSELDVLQRDARIRLATLMLFLWEDEANDGSGPSLKSAEYVQAWAHYCQQMSEAHQALRVLATEVFDVADAPTPQSPRAGVEQVLQRWEDAYGLLADLLTRYSARFCESDARKEEIAAEWLSDHMKRLEAMGSAKVATRGRTPRQYKLKISNSADATDKVQRVEPRPPMSPAGIRSALDSLDATLSTLDKAYDDISVRGSLFDHPMTHTRRLIVKEMLGDHHRTLRELDRLANEPEMPDDLRARMRQHQQQCWERGVLLQAVLESPQINAPLENILEPRWRDGVVRANEPARGATIVDVPPWIDSNTRERRFEQYIRIQLDDEPVLVLLPPDDEPRSFPVQPSFMHVHLKTTEQTKISSLEEFRPEMLRWTRLKIKAFDEQTNTQSRQKLRSKHGFGSDASPQFACDVIAQVVGRKKETSAASAAGAA